MIAILLTLLLAAQSVAPRVSTPTPPQGTGVTPLPFDLKGPRIGMTEAEFKDVRPAAIENTSVDGYSEVFPSGLPFVDRVEYQFRSRDWFLRRQLSEIHLARSWQLAGHPEEIDELVPGLLYGAHRLWGEPSRFGTITLPVGGQTGRAYRVVRILWRRPEGLVILQYSPRSTIESAIRDSDHAAPLSIEIWLGTEKAAQARLNRLPLNEEPVALKDTFIGFPNQKPAGPVLE